MRLALLLGLAGLALLKVGAQQICGTGICRALPWDTTVLSALHALRSPALDTFFAVVTWAGSLYLLLPIAIVMALLDKQATHYFHRWFIPLALCATWIVVHSAKILVARPRPVLFDALITLPVDGSYPSAHAAQITAFACAWLAHPGCRTNAPLIGLLFITTLNVGLSRLYLQVHYPSDVVYGMATGVLYVAALSSLRRTDQAHP